MAKFTDKDVLVFSKTQNVEGTPVTLAGVDALLATDLTYKDTISKDTLEYVGDSLSHDEENIITDHYAELTCNLFMPSRGDQVLATADALPSRDWFESAGGAVTLAGTLTTDQILTIDNNTATSALLTQQFRRSTSEVATEKTYEIYDARGTMDLTVEITKRTILKFNEMGNYSIPTNEVALTPVFGAQKAFAATTVNSSSITIAELTGTNVTHVGTAGTNKTICFSKVDAPNFFGFALERFQTSCQDGFNKSAGASDVTITILEEEAHLVAGESVTSYDPYNHLGDAHKFTLRYGSVQGQVVTIYFDQLQLVDIVDTSVSGFAGKDLKFRNVGKAQIVLS